MTDGKWRRLPKPRKIPTPNGFVWFDPLNPEHRLYFGVPPLEDYVPHRRELPAD